MSGVPGSKLSTALADIQEKFDEGAAVNVRSPDPPDCPRIAVVVLPSVLCIGQPPAIRPPLRSPVASRMLRRRRASS